VEVPETSMDENDRRAAGEDQVGFAHDRARLQGSWCPIRLLERPRPNP
jgi:hypothetical protein